MIYTLEELNSLNVQRQLQTVGKARKLAVWINGAASRQNLIRQFCKGKNTDCKKILLNNTTRWNSTYSMINSLLYHEDIIKALNYDKKTDLNDDDWIYLKEIVKVLQRFYVITMKMQQTSKCTVAECNFYFNDILVNPNPKIFIRNASN